MSDSEERPQRRKRYGGKYPRRFDEKYKERHPERFPETVAKVIASGKTPAGSHVPILVAESLAALQLRPGLIGIDATLGYGGHALRILEQITPGGKLLGFDVDPVEQPKTEARLREAGYSEAEFVAVRMNYAGLSKALAARGLSRVDFVFADLGCSSMQYDDPSRGFSFKAEGPLDMRMNPSRGISAREWLQKIKPDLLEETLRANADEPRSELLAPLLAGKDFATTSELVKTIRQGLAATPEEVDLTVRRVFQAVRIAVNEEFSALDAFLRVLPECLAVGGRAAVLTFHSGEDRRVKKAFQAGHRNGRYSAISDHVTSAGPEERRQNPRSAAAKLRWAVRSTVA